MADHDPRILALDQAPDVTGWALRADTVTGYDWGVIKAPALSKRGGLTEAHWMKYRITELIEAWKPGWLAIEGVYIGKNPETGIALAEFRGRILSYCEDHSLPCLTVSIPETMDYLHLHPGTPRKLKKSRAQFFATALVQGQVYATHGGNTLIEVDAADAICILEIAEAKLRAMAWAANQQEGTDA